MLYNKPSGNSAYNNESFLAQLMIIDVGFPKNYLAGLTVQNNEKQRLQQTAGIPYIEKKPSIKEGGIEATIAVIKNQNGQEEWFKEIDGEIVNFEKSKILRVTHHPYPFIYARSQELLNQKKRFGFNFQKNGAGDTAVDPRAEFPEPTIIKTHPNPNPAQEKNEDKNFKDLISYAELTEAQRSDEIYKGIVEAETERQNEWATILSAYSQLSEEDASTEMVEVFSRRLSLCNFDRAANRFKFFPMIPGLTFTAQVKGFEITPFAWDKDTRKYVHYTAGTINPSTEESKARALKIYQMHLKSLEEAK